MAFDVVIVGAGPAGLAAAIHGIATDIKCALEGFRAGPEPAAF